ncbi:MAG: GNAT family N-acetyltransferase [Oscillospiraceae bacterium]|nr:GNAT family N-acetyltransferase [Oscillospiraceae bacterium]
MEIKKATNQEMLSLWGYESADSVPPTALFFQENIRSGNAEFWTLNDNGQIIGELYIFWRLGDPDFADGKSRAYLCAFRVKSEYRGKGYGSFLLKEVLEYIKNKGFQIATIGVDATEEHNIRLYHRFGFINKVKDCFEDPCDVDSEMKPKACPCFWLLSKSL